MTEIIESPLDIESTIQQNPLQNEIWPFKKKPILESKKEDEPPSPLTPLSNDNLPPATIIHPRKNVEVEEEGNVFSYNEQLDSLFFDLASQNTIETDTERTRYLQDILDKFCEEQGLDTKLYILKRGTDPNAFAVADGSIFLFQSLIDKVDSLDELFGVLGHELGHIKYKTFVNKVASHDQSGTGWLHESASDSLAPEVLETLGFNTTALNSALKKVSPTGRGFAHQTSTMRATENVGLHAAIGYESSSKPFTPLPDFLKGEKAIPLNNQIIDEAMKTGSFRHITDHLDYLYPTDLASAFYSALNPYESYNFIDTKTGEYSFPDEYHDTIHSFHLFFQDQLTKKGYSQQDINNFIFIRSASEHYTGGIHDFSYITSPENLVSIFDNLSEYNRSHTDADINKTLFNSSEDKKNILDLSVDTLLEFYFNPEKQANKYGIALTPQTMTSIIKSLHNQRDRSILLPRKIGDTVEKYVKKEFAIESGETVTVKSSYGFGDETETVNVLRLDKEKARNFLQDLKNAGVILDKEDLRNNYFIEFSPNANFEEETRNLIKEIFEMHDEEPEIRDFDKELNSFIETFCSRKDISKRIGKASEFTYFLNVYTQDLSDQEKTNVLEKIFERLDEQDFSEEAFPMDDPMFHSNFERYTPEMRKYAVKEILILNTFETDTNEFYQLLEKTMNNSGIDLSQGNLSLLVDLSSNLLKADSFPWEPYYLRNARYPYKIGSLLHLRVRDYARYCELPYIKAIIDYPSENFNSIGEINKAIEETKRSAVTWKEDAKGKIYDSSLLPLLFGRTYRDSFEKIIGQGIENEDPNELATYISNNFPDSPRTTYILRLLDTEFLYSTASLASKVRYLDKQFDRVGPDGMVIVANQIDNPQDYEYFREEMGRRLETYLSGSNTITRLAVTDNVTSSFSKEHYLLFGTTKNDEATRISSSTSLAKAWLQTWLENAGYSSHSPVIYSEADNSFHVDSSGRQVFRSLADTIESMKQMSEGQRVAIALKALVDAGGALQTDWGKKNFADKVVKSTGISDSFVKKAISIGIDKAPSEFIGIPAARMVAPLLFRALDTHAINYRDLRSKDGTFKVGTQKISISDTNLHHILTSPTRDIVWFGREKTEDPTSSIARIVYDSDDSFRFVNDELERLLEPVPDDEFKNPETSIHNTAAESVIRAVESSGALGVRALQLARQLYHFSPDVDARLAQSFDANKGLNKLLFWENLYRLASQDQNGTAKFIQENLDSIGEFLGGGSLYTTFSAHIKTGEGEQKDVVFKMLNPNPELFINTSYKTAVDVLDEIGKDKDKKDSNLAGLGKIFVDLSQEWCLADINDTQFERDDDDFRLTIDKYNRETGSEHFFVPERYHTSFRLKCEEKAEGRTLNKILSDETISSSIKAQLVNNVKDLYKFQLQEAGRETDEGKIHIVHSDPHIGNFVVDIKYGQTKIGIIDRSMYLKLSENQAQMFVNLLETGNYREFVGQFLDEIIEANNIEGEGARKAVKSSVYSNVQGEYIRQRLSSLVTRREPDNLALLRRLMSGIEKENLSVPLNMRLMIRNIQSIRELENRYSA